jgi:DNA (cytosine-5)-methyltransferase 1
MAGARSGLWTEMARIIGEVQPKYIFVENSPALIVRGIGGVLGDMAAMGYDVRWGVLGARSCGGPVERERVWIAGPNKKYGKKGVGFVQHGSSKIQQRVAGQCPEFWLQAPSECFGVEHGVDSYVDQVSAIGNGQVPAVAALAWEILSGENE